MKAVFLLMMLVGQSALACKMTPLGSDLRAYDAIFTFIGQNEKQQDSSISGVYHIKGGYAYEVVSQGKCQARAVKVEVGAACDHKVIGLNDKIKCRLK